LSDGTLAALGWTDELEAAFTTHAERGFEPARVVAEHRGGDHDPGEEVQPSRRRSGVLEHVVLPDHEGRESEPSVARRGGWRCRCLTSR
jgi:hypothetical protein